MTGALVIVAVLAAFWLMATLTGENTAMNEGPFNFAQLVSLAQNAGFSGTDAETAAAIALAESSGNPNAIGDQGTSYGLWQIHYTVHPEFLKDQLFDPYYNANAAFQLFERKGDFTDWTTYNTGAYLARFPSGGQNA